MMTRVLQLLKWNKPTTTSKHKKFYQAEKELLTYVLDDPYVPWSALFSDRQLKKAITGVLRVFSMYGSPGYKEPSGDSLAELVERLANRLPPILVTIDREGKPDLVKVKMSQTLYAGWVYWLGQKHLTNQNQLSFFLINRLCDHALLQQRAINLMKARPG
jgi:hypothetical protein